MYKGNLKFPYGYGTVFTRFTQEDFVKTDLFTLLPPELVLSREEIDPANKLFSQENLLNKIQNMFPIRFKYWEPLGEDDVRAIRYHLFPEIRISSQVKEEHHYEEKVLLSLRELKVMDLYQENLAKTLGDKHRLLRGVAGSGKTLVLACRAKYLSKLHPEWKILVLCYNISLAIFIKQMIDEIELETENNVEVYNFHAWSYKNWKLRDEAMVEELIKQIKNGDTVAPVYDAILIDEGQDFEPGWLRLVMTTLNPETSSFLLVEDRAQKIYHRKHLAQEIGINFRGRSRILTINYRKNDLAVKISTIESSKGLEFKVVFICNVNNCPLFLEKEIEREVSLLYIGMTRAVEKLYLTYSGESAFTKYFETIDTVDEKKSDYFFIGEKNILHDKVVLLFLNWLRQLRIWGWCMAKTVMVVRVRDFMSRESCFVHQGGNQLMLLLCRN